MHKPICVPNRRKEEKKEAEDETNANYAEMISALDAAYTLQANQTGHTENGSAELISTPIWSNGSKNCGYQHLKRVQINETKILLEEQASNDQHQSSSNTSTFRVYQPVTKK